MANLFVSIAVFLMVIVLHEIAHGLAAYWMGDDTAQKSGRLSINPLVHIDMVGTVILPFILIVTNSPVVFGWAKPVPIDISNFRNPKRGLCITSLAGPLSNFLLAGIFAFLLKGRYFSPDNMAVVFLAKGFLISLVLGIFNMIPIPPLDGAGVIIGILPDGLAAKYARLEKYGFLIIFLFLYLGLFRIIIMPIVFFISRFVFG